MLWSKDERTVVTHHFCLKHELFGFIMWCQRSIPLLCIIIWGQYWLCLLIRRTQWASHRCFGNFWSPDWGQADEIQGPSTMQPIAQVVSRFLFSTYLTAFFPFLDSQWWPGQWRVPFCECSISITCLPQQPCCIFCLSWLTTSLVLPFSESTKISSTK